ncbi:MAG TPA: hypothetical protein VMR86_00320 [Myxococcota bacterium]|nr:hypothetical protein [Myxococcota bacterium]
MSRHRISIAAGLTLLVATAGCFVHPIRLDDIEYAHFDDTRPREIRAEECGALVFFLPFRLNSQLIRVQRTLAAHAPDSVLSDVRVEQSWMWIGIGDLMCTKVSAIAYPKLP